MKNIPIHFPLFIWGSIVIIISGLVALFYVLHPAVSFASLYSTIEQTLGVGKLVSSSTVEVTKSNDQLWLRFQIVDEDKGKAAAFSQKLGVSEDWEQGIALGVDQRNLAQIEPVLPLKANMSFEGQKIVLSSSSLNLLKSSLSPSAVEFATGSARFNWNSEGNRYRLTMTNPGELLVYATSSGKLNLSKKINAVFPIAEKIDTIELNIQGKSVDGEIFLK